MLQPSRENLQLFCLDHCLLGTFCRFPLDYFSYVCLIPFFQTSFFFPNEALTEASSIAIWDRNKFVVTIATIVWVASLVAIIQGKLFPFLPSTDDRGYHINVILY